MNSPTVKQLRYFTRLEKLGHFGKAADACFISQSAFSTAIQELESILGTQLVDRTNKKITITRIGKEIAAQARLILMDIDGLMQIANESNEPLSGNLRLGIIPTIAPFLLPKILPLLRAEYPKLKLYLQEDTTQRIYEELMTGELDVLIIAMPFALRNVESMVLFKDPFMLAYRKGSKFIKAKQYLITQLKPESILLLEDAHCMRGHALSACKIRNLNMVSRFDASSLLTLIEMVDVDIGITFLPEMAKNFPMLLNTNIETRPLGVGSHREVGIVWRKGSAKVKEFRMLGKFIKKHRKGT